MPRSVASHGQVSNKPKQKLPSKLTRSALQRLRSSAAGLAVLRASHCVRRRQPPWFKRPVLKVVLTPEAKGRLGLRDETGRVGWDQGACPASETHGGTLGCLVASTLDMSPYINAQPIREHVAALSDGGELSVALLHGTGPDAGKRCIHRVTTDTAGRLRSDILYFYDGTVKERDVEADFDALARNGNLSMSQLHHTEAMLNRGRRLAR